LTNLITKFEQQLLDINFKAFIFQHQWHKDFFVKLFPFLSDIRTHIAPLAYPDYSFFNPFLSDQFLNSSSHVHFLCIATDFFSKGLPLLLEAWKRLPKSIKSIVKLTIVTPSIPLNFAELVSDKSIEVILKKKKLSLEEKINLYTKCHCFLNLALTDSGIGAEALSFGIPIISTKLLSTDMYVDSSNGCVIQIPLSFYGDTPLSFYTNFREFLVDYHKCWDIGDFEDAVTHLSECIAFCVNEDRLLKMSISSLKKFRSSFSSVVRNKVVLELYSQVTP
jgi:glycosyltransferase involved in cell wall biosynthesis